MKRILILLAALSAAALFPFGWLAAEEQSVKQQIKESSREFHKKARAARQEAGKEFRKVRAEGRKARLEAKRRIKGESKKD